MIGETCPDLMLSHRTLRTADNERLAASDWRFDPGHRALLI
jgi:hypothetical protein